MNPPTPSSELVVLVGLAQAQGVAAVLASGGLRTMVLQDLDELSPALRDSEVAVVCLGPALCWQRVQELLASWQQERGADAAIEIVLIVNAPSHQIDQLAEAHEGLLPLLATADMGMIVETLRATAAAYQIRRRWQNAAWGDDAMQSRVHRAIGRIGQSLRQQDEPARLCAQLAEVLHELVGADEARFWSVEQNVERLRPIETGASGEGEGEPMIGLTGLAARSRAAIVSASFLDDPRAYPRIDARGASGEIKRLLAVPITDRFGQCLAVAVLARYAGRPAFDSETTTAACELLEAALPHFLRHFAPDFEHLGGRTAERRRRLRESVFRKEAVVALEPMPHEGGAVLRLEERWVPWLYRLMALGAALLLSFGIFMRVGEYAEGPAVLQIGERTQVSAPEAGAVAKVLVAPTATVRTGQVLAHLEGRRQASMTARLEEEFAARLRERLRDPGSQQIGAQLIEVRTRLNEARDRMAERVVRAPHGGVVSDVRIRPGQTVEQGEVLLSVVRDQTRHKIIALLPGGFRPKLQVGQSLRLEVAGFPYLYQMLKVTHVGDEVIGGQEAQRYFGPALADAVKVESGVVLVEGRLTEALFVDGRNHYRLHNGMLGRAEVKVDEARLLLALIPALRSLGGAEPMPGRLGNKDAR